MNVAENDENSVPQKQGMKTKEPPKSTVAWEAVGGNPIKPVGQGSKLRYKKGGQKKTYCQCTHPPLALVMKPSQAIS